MEQQKKIILFVIVFLAAVGFYFYKTNDGRKQFLRVEPDSATIYQGTIQQFTAWYDPDSSAGPAPEVEVTREAEWSSSDPAIAYVGNEFATKGDVRAPRKGTVAITVRYKDFTSSAQVTVAEAPMEIACKADFVPVRTGEQIGYLVYFIKPGVPDYQYQWTAPENQTSTDVNPIFIFNNKGPKVVHVVVTDKAGATKEADCEPLEIQ